MPLFIGTTLLCLTCLWFVVLLIAERNPKPPWWTDNFLLGDLQFPLMMLLAFIGIMFLTRFPASHSPVSSSRGVDILAAAGVVLVTGLIIRKMKVGRRLKQFAEMQADDQDQEISPVDPSRMVYLHRKLPWQVRLHLAEKMGYSLSWVRALRCVVREMAGQPGRLRLLAFDPDQAKAQGVVIIDYDTLAVHPELVAFSGVFETNSQRVTIDSEPPRRAA